MNLAASFQKDEEAADVQAVRPPEVGNPNEGTDDSWGSMIDRFKFDLEPGRQATWLRLVSEPIEDPQIRACGLAFLSDAIMTGPSRTIHPTISREPNRESDTWARAWIMPCISIVGQFQQIGCSPMFRPWVYVGLAAYLWAKFSMNKVLIWPQWYKRSCSESSPRAVKY